jgi:hypothetical protein
VKNHGNLNHDSRYPFRNATDRTHVRLWRYTDIPIVTSAVIAYVRGKVQWVNFDSLIQIHMYQITSYLTNQPTIYMEQSPSLEANRSSASQENSSHCTEPDDSLAYSQDTAICPYIETYQSSPSLLIPLTEDTFQYYPPIYA